MIKTEGGQVMISASDEEMLAELAVIIRAVKTVLENKYGDETTREMIAETGRLAYLTDEELDAMETEAKKWRREAKLEDEDVPI